MSDVMTLRLRQAETDSDNTGYVRMIPGCSGHDGANAGARQERERLTTSQQLERTPRPDWLRMLLPQPTAENRFALLRLVAADQAILVATCLALSLPSQDWSLATSAIPVYVALVTLFGFSEGLYQTLEQRSPASLIPGLTKSVLFSMALMFIATHDETPATAFPVTFLASVGGLSAWRYLAAVRCRGQRKSGKCSNVLIVGAGPAGRAIAQALRDPVHERVMLGFLDDYSPLSPDVLGDINDLAWLARAEFVDEVILALPHQPARTRAAAEIARRNRLDVRCVLDLPVEAGVGAGIERVSGIPLITLHREQQPQLALLLKRMVDIVGATACLVIAGPLMALVALLIKLDTKGPAIYAAPRTGAKGRLFRCYKFRSMVTNADQLKAGLRSRNQREGPIFKIDDDPRITRIGRIIRRYSLDELPQLWNVLRGEMSLVGPRPHPADEVDHYELQHFRRLDVKPGLTGLWQVTARKNPSFDLNMHLDLTYIEHWSLMLDLRILFRTLHVLFVPEGS